MKEAGIITPESKDRYGIRHSGNGLLGVGMTLDLEQIPQKIMQILIIGLVRSEEQTFMCVQSAHCRIIDRSGFEFGRCQCYEKSNKSCFIFARLQREVGKKRWGFQAIGEYVDVTSLKAVADQAKKTYSMSFRQLETAIQASFNANTGGAERTSNSSALESRKHVIVSL